MGKMFTTPQLIRHVLPTLIRLPSALQWITPDTAATSATAAAAAAVEPRQAKLVKRQ
jgi:hypothetical protein